MAIKRISSILIAIIMTVLCSVSVLADDNVLTIGRAYVYMPEIVVELNGTGYDAKGISATLGSESLSVTSIKAFAPQTDSVRTYAVVDLSGSMSGSANSVKSCLYTFVGNMGPKDSLVLITFGETVDTVLKGSESVDEIKSAISKLSFDKGGTLFYEALTKACQLATANQSSFDREYILAFSDGMDYQKGSSTFNEAIQLFSSHTVPIYAFCAPNASQEAADKFGELARGSGGALKLQTGNANTAFSELTATINNVSILKLKAKSNIANGDTKLLTIKSDTSEASVQIPLLRSIPDSEAPVADKVTFDPDNNSFSIHFTKSVLNADKPTAYDITDAKGKKLVVSEAKYYEETQTVLIRLHDLVYNGEYTIGFNGITDHSKEANKLTASTKAVVEGVTKPVEFPWFVLYIIGGVLLLGILVVILIVVLGGKKKSDQNGADSDNEIPVRLPDQQVENEYQAGGGMQVKHHIKAPSSVHVSLKIKTGRTAEQKVSVDIVSSLIVGRSDTCDLYVDDTKLSRQHFVLENDNGSLFVTDLGSTNGTMLNGIRVGSRQRISNGDKIYAGLSDIYISF